MPPTVPFVVVGAFVVLLFSGELGGTSAGNLRFSGLMSGAARGRSRSPICLAGCYVQVILCVGEISFLAGDRGIMHNKTQHYTSQNLP